MSNEDTPENADKEPKSMQGSSEEQPPEPREDATRPNPALEPTEQDEPEEAARREPPPPSDGATGCAAGPMCVEFGPGWAAPHSIPGSACPP